MSWLVNGQRFFNQIETWRAMDQTGQPGRFCLFEEAYDRHDWSQNPVESWEELVRTRCTQLRQKYRHLVMLFSGGRDSSFALRSFIANEIPVDEILIVNYQHNPLRLKEYQTWIKPQAENYARFNPRVKITTMTIDFNDYSDWYTEDWSQKKRATTQRGYFQPSDYTWMIERQCQFKDSNTGIVNGLDKPLLKAQGNDIYSVLCETPFLHYFNNPDIMEFFYFTPDLPELHIKQCHMMLDYLAQHYPDKSVDFLRTFHERPNEYYDEYCLSIGRGAAVDISNPAQNGQNKYSGTHPVFKILSKLIKNSDQHRVWDRYVENMRWIQDQAPNAFFDVSDRLHWGHAPLWSKPRFIRKWHKNDQTSSSTTSTDPVHPSQCQLIY